MDSCKKLMKEWSLDQAASGILSGGITTILLHPLDLVKTQFQVHTTSKSAIQSKPLFYTFRYLFDIYKSHGFFHGLYQGLSANIAGNTISWGLYFYLYSKTKSLFSKDRKGNLSSAGYFVSSGLASMMTVVVANPFWMMKTRLCMQVPGAVDNYRGLRDGLGRVFNEEGLKGLYRGLIPGLVGVSHGAIQFTVYEQMKNLLFKDKNQKMTNLEYLLTSSCSKIIATTATYPYQVVRSRLQIKSQGGGAFVYESVLDVIWRTWRYEGLWAFYKGIVPSTIRVLPGTCLTFFIYEKSSNYFNQ